MWMRAGDIKIFHASGPRVVRNEPKTPSEGRFLRDSFEFFGTMCATTHAHTHCSSVITFFFVFFFLKSRHGRTVDGINATDAENKAFPHLFIAPNTQQKSV